MEILVLAVGRCREPAILDLVEEYRRRCPWVVRLRELLPGRDPDAEARALLAAAPDGAMLAALDEHGQDLTSVEFAGRLARWRDDGERAVAFLIGGADGHGAEVLEKARLKLALGRMTWPHQLARVMLVEQIYRASTILAGHPYHRG